MKRPPQSRRPERRALVLVTVLWVVVLLTVIVTMTAKATRLDVRVGAAAAGQTRGRWACRAGLEKAIALLQQDPPASDCLTDRWNDNPDELDNISLPRARCRVTIIDDTAKLNLNTAPRKQLIELPNMTNDIVAAILDWRDHNDEPRPNGAETEYYSDLTIGYRPANSAFKTIRELLLVKDVTPELLYGEDTNGNGRLDLNENDGDASAPMDNADDLLDKGWAAYLTCHSYDRNTDSQGATRVNINEADEQKLKDSLGLSPEHAKWIVDNRSQGQYTSIGAVLAEENSNAGQDKDKRPLDTDTFKKIGDRITITNDERITGLVNVNTAPRPVLVALLQGDGRIADDIIAYRETLTDGMVSIAELLNLKSVTVRKFKEIAPKVTTRSCVFTVQAQATDTGAHAVYAAEAVIDRKGNPSKILYLYQGANH